MRPSIVVGTMAGLAALFAASASGPPPASAAPPETRPNVVVVMTDDQTVEQLRAMPRVAELLAARGTTFDANVASYPLCCPSRATYLTGQYPHNHGVWGNKAPHGGFGKLDEQHTLPVWLSRAGYHTGHIGKFLNGYGTADPTHVPPGWAEWQASIDPYTYRFYGYRLNENGRVVEYGDRPEDYQADVYTAKAVDYVRRNAPRPEPFFLSVAYLAPHSGGPNVPGTRCAGSAKPAPRHEGRFADAELPRPPSFNEPDVTDKPSAIQALPRFGQDRIDRITRDYQCRRESLLAVDEGVAKLVDALRAAGELDRTMIVFTADNGFFQGEHRIPGGKVKLYEESIRVPLIIRGPGVPAGGRVDTLSANIDLAPTIVDATKARPDHPLDGRSLLASPNGRAILLENGPADGPRNPRYHAIRTERYVYAEYVTGERELYDLRTDPHQLRSVHDDPAYRPTRQALATALADLRDCAGANCQRQVRVPDPVGR